MQLRELCEHKSFPLIEIPPTLIIDNSSTCSKGKKNVAFKIYSASFTPYFFMGKEKGVVLFFLSTLMDSPAQRHRGHCFLRENIREGG